MTDLFGDEDSQKIIIDGRWDLEDLYKFPRAYEQVYFALYSLSINEIDTNQRIQHAYRSMPWQSGYSAVNFYNNLKYNTPKKDRPKVLSLKYSSLGWIELGSVAVSTAASIALIVKSICSAINNVNDKYTNVHKGLSERKLLEVKTQRAENDLAMLHAKFIKHSNNEMANILQIPNIDYVNNITGNELKTLKIQLSIFRRMRILCDFQTKGKIKL